MQLRNVSTNVYNVKRFGAYGNRVADDTAAIQAATNACIAAGGGVVFFPNGKYKVGGPLITNLYGGANPNCQIYVPKVSNPATNGGKPVSITFLFESAPPLVDGPLVDNNAEDWDAGAIIFSTISGTGTRPAVFGTVGEGAVYGPFNYVDVKFENVWVRVKNDGTMCGINMGAAINTEYKRSRADTTAAGINVAQPVSETFGFIGGFTNGGTSYPFIDTLAVGFKYGYLFSEHSTGDNVQAMCCYSAFAVAGGSHHAMNFQRLCSFWNKYNFVSDVVNAGYAHIDVQQLDIEQRVAGDWFDYAGNIYDPANNIHGSLKYNCVSSGVGATPDGFTNVGAANFICESIDYREVRTLSNATAGVEVNAFIHKTARLILNGNKTFSFTRLQPGKSGEVYLVQDGTGGRTITWPAHKTTGNLTLSTAANAVDLLIWRYDGVNLYLEVKQYA